MKKQLMTMGLAAAMALTMAGCSSNGADTTADDSANKEEAKEILIGISPDYPPFESKDASGQIEGFDVDMTEWLFKWLNENGHNYTYDFEELAFENIISALQAGQIDLGITGFSKDPDREGIFSEPYYTSIQKAVVKADSDVQTVEDLKGKAIGVQKGANACKKGAEEIEDASIQELGDVNVLMETLKADGLDGVVVDQAVADSFASTGEFKVLDADFNSTDIVIYTTEANQDLLDEMNEAIKAFKASPDYETYTTKWFAPDEAND